MRGYIPSNANKRSRKLLYSIVIILFAIIAILLYFDWRGTGFYFIPSQQPIDLPNQYRISENADWYTVDNARFGIDNNGNHARATTDGINAALVWAKEQGYTNIRFPGGTYLIQCTWNNRYIAPTDGIIVPSGLTLDLGDSTFQMETNDYPAYSIFSVVNQSDVTIVGGTLIGDLGTHVFSASAHSSSHEWGFGICISASNNVLIQNVTIKNMTGDGIILEGSYRAMVDGGEVSTDVKIYLCDISNCRRQGISVVGCSNCEIAGNKIYDISGSDPQFGIDIESEFDYVISNLKIHNNTFFHCTGGAISCHDGEYYSVYSNTCIGDSIIAIHCNDVEIYKNSIKSSRIHVYKEASDIRVYSNQLDLLSRQLIEN